MGEHKIFFRLRVYGKIPPSIFTYKKLDNYLNLGNYCRCFWTLSHIYDFLILILGTMLIYHIICIGGLCLKRYAKLHKFSVLLEYHLRFTLMYTTLQNASKFYSAIIFDKI